jgi:tetratricopeptide (TPR) repeat protein
MEGKDLRRAFEDVTSGRKQVEDLDPLVAAMTPDDLRDALDYVAARVGATDEVAEVASWTRLTADLLTRWAASSSAAYAGIVANTAADLYRTDLQDPAAADEARAVSAIKTLAPGALANLYEQRGTRLPEEARLRLLRALVTLGTDAIRQRYEPILAGLNAERDSRRSRETEGRGILDEARELLESGGDVEEAVAILDSHLSRHPADAEALSLAAIALARIHGEAGIEDRYARGLAVSEGAQRARLLVDLGWLRLETLGDVARSVDAFEAALDVDRSQNRALEGLVEAMTSLGKVDVAVALLERIRAELTGHAGEASVLPILARTYQHLGRTPDAERVWRRLRAVDPRNAAALRFYEDYHRERGDHQKLFTTLQFALSVVDDIAEKIRINKVMAGLAETALMNLERAIEAYKRVLLLDPTDSGAEGSLVALYERTHKWHALVEFYNDRLRRLPADAVDERVSTLFKVIENYQDPERLPNADNVLATYARIVEISPTNRQALETLARGYEDRERWPDLLKVLQKKVLVTQDPSELLEIFKQIAEIAITRMSNETQAIPFLERILELDPENLEVVQRLKSIYQRKHNQEKLYGMHLRELRMLTGAEREGALLAAANMARDRLLRYDEALRLFEELYRMNTGSREARENLHQLYSRLEQWSDYATFLAEEIERPMPLKRRVELCQKLGEVHMDRLGNTAKAREVFTMVLRLDPSDDIAARRLEHIFLEQDDLAALHDLFMQRGDLRSYVALLSQREGREVDVSRRISLNLAMARTCEADLEEPARALRYLEKAFQLDPGLTDVGRRILDVSESQGDWARAAEILRQLAPVTEDPSERLELYRRLRTTLEQAGRLEEAFKAGMDAVRTAMLLADVGEDLGRLREIAGEASIWQEYAAFMEEVVDGTSDAASRRELLLELGLVYKNRLLFHDEARRAIERLLDLDPGNLEALDLLEDIALQQEDYVGLETVLRRRIDMVQEAGKAREIQMRLGRLYEDLLGEDQAAADCYMQVVQSDPEDRTALAGLHRTLERSERFAELADIIRMEIGSAGSDWDRGRLQCELARALWEHLDEIDEAVLLLDEVLSADARNADALQQLKILFDRRLARDAAANVLAPFFRAQGLLQDLGELLEARIEDMVRPDARAAILMELADIRLATSQDTGAAFSLVAEAVHLFPAEGWVDRMMDLANRTGRFEDAAKVIGRWVGIVPEGFPVAETALPDPAREARLSLELGRLYCNHLEQPELAIKALEKALPFLGEDDNVLRMLLGLYGKVGDRDAVLSTFDRLADALEGGERNAILVEKARFCRAEGLADESIDTLFRILQFGRDPDSESMLESLLAEQERWDDVAALLERREQEETDPDARADVLLSLATLNRDRLGRPERAAELLRRALQDAPAGEDLRVACEALLASRNLPGYREFAPPLLAALENVFRTEDESRERLESLLLVRADIAGTPWDRVVALRDVAAMARSRGDTRAAFEAVKRALDAMPDDSELLETLIATGRETGNIDGVCLALEEIAPRAAVDSRIRILLEVARMARTDLHDGNRAMAIYDQLLELEPGSLAVLREMDALLHSQGREAERIPLLNDMAIGASSLDEKRSIHMDIADLCQATGDFEGATRALNYVIERRAAEDELDALAHDAVLRLVALHESLGRTREAVDLRLLLGRIGSAPHERREQVLAAARSLRDVLRESSQASQLFDELLKESPADEQVLDDAKLTARDARDYDRLLTLLSHEIEGEFDSDRKRIARVEAAEITGLRGGEGVGLALDHLEAVLGEMPSSPEALAMLSRLIDVPGQGERAASLLLQAAGQSGDRGLEARALRELAGMAEDPDRKADLVLRAAACMADLGRRQDAAEILAATWSAQPGRTDVFDALVDALEATGATGELARIAFEAAGVSEDSPERMELRLRSAANLVRWGLPGEATPLLEANCAEDATHGPTLELLVAAYTNLERADKVLWAMDLSARTHEGKNERIEALMGCGEYARDHVRDLAASAVYFREVLGLEPLHARALESLSVMLEQTGDGDGLADLRRHELAAREHRSRKSDAARIAALRRMLMAGSAESGDASESIRLARELLAGEATDDDIRSALAIWETFGRDPELFRAIANGYESRLDREGLLKFVRHAASLGLEDPSPEAALRMAVELGETLGHDETLFEDLAGLVSMVPTDTVVRNRLEAVGRRMDRLEQVKDILLKVFGRHSDNDVAFDLAVQISRLLRQDLNREDEAADYLRVAFLKRPGDVSTVTTLIELYERTERFGDLALLHESLGELSDEPSIRVECFLDAYRVLRDRMDDLGGAAEMLRKVLEQDGEHRFALEALEDIARLTGDLPALEQWLRRRIERASSPMDRRGAALELASIQHEQMRNPDAAIDTLTALIQTDPGCEDAWRRAEDLFSKAERWAELARLFDREAENSTSSDVRFDRLTRAAEICEKRLQDLPSACDFLVRARQTNPEDQETFNHLAALLERMQRYDELVELLRGRLLAGASTTQQVDLNTRIGVNLALRLDDVPGAAVHFKAALALDPYHAEAREGLSSLLVVPEVAMDAALTLEQVYETAGDFKQLRDILRHEVSLVEFRAEREVLRLRIAELEMERLDDPDASFGTLSAALDENPGAGEVLAQLDVLAKGTRQWDRFFQILEDILARSADSGAAAELHLRAGRVAEEQLGLLARAAEHYSAWLATNPGNLDVLARLDLIYQELNRPEELVGVLKSRLAATPEGKAEPELRVRLAVLLARDNHDLDGAIDQLRTVLETDPVNREAIRQLSLMVEIPMVMRPALDLLMRAFRESGDDEGLLWASERAIEVAGEATDTVTFHDIAARTARRIGKRDLELEHLAQALLLVPSDEEVLARFLMSCRDQRAQEKAFAVLRSVAQAASWGSLEKSLLLQAIRIASEGGVDSDEVETCLTRVIEIDPECREALEELDRRYSKFGRFEDLIGVLDKLVRLDLSPSERVVLLRRLAEIHEARKEISRSAASLEEAAVLEPGNVEILLKLVSLRDQLKDPPAHIRALERLAAALDDPQRKVEVLLDVARLQENILGDLVGARGTLEEILTIEPDSGAARLRLEVLYETLNDYMPLLRMLAETVEGSGPANERVAAAMKAVSISELKLDNLPTALAMCRKALEIDPGSESVVDEAIRLFYRAEDWSGLVNMLRRKASLVTGRSDKVSLLARAAEISATRLGDASMAGAIARQIIGVDPQNTKALYIMATLMEKGDRIMEALNLFRRLAQTVGDSDEKVEALVGIARIRLAQEDGVEESRGVLKAAAAINPQAVEVNRLLKQLYIKTEDHQALVEVMQRDLKHAADDSERATICMDIAEIHLKQFHNGQKFLEWAEEAHRFRRDNPRVVSGIVNYHLRSGEARRAVPYLEWLVNWLDGKRRLKELPPYAHELGKILESMGQAEKAVQYYRICHEHDAGNLPNALALGRLYMTAGEHEKALRVYQPLIVRIDSLKAPQRVELLLSLARINLERGDGKKARQFVLRVLAEEPDNSEAQALLAKGL